jgi:molybdopterin-guanine dinucleotide biosynthesis protein A
MGSDKALLHFGSRTLLERAAATVAAVAPRVLLACGPSARYGDLGLPLAIDLRLDAGPLAGLEAALASASEAGEEWIIVLACDLPRVRPEVLELLVARARERDLDACLFETELGLEPLCAVYRRTCLASVQAALDAGERKMVAFLRHPTARGHLPRSATVRADAFADCLTNVNSPADLIALAAHEEML